MEYVEFRKSPFMFLLRCDYVLIVFQRVYAFFKKFGLGIPLQQSVQSSILFCMPGIVLDTVFCKILPFPTQVQRWKKGERGEIPP